MTNLDTDPRFQWWRDALAGRAPEAVIDDPQPGFYWTGRGTERKPVVIYPGEGELLADVGFGGTTSKGLSASEVWPRCYSHPITDEVYWDTIDNGRWADLEGIVEPKPAEEAPVEPGGNLAVGSNNPPEDIPPIVAITEEVDNAIAALNAILPKPGEVVKDQALADRLANSQDRLRELWTKANKQRIIEKRPHDEAAAAVQALWKPLVEEKVGRIHAAASKAAAAVTGYLKWAKAEQERIQREAEAAAARERERLEQERLQREAEAAETGEPIPEEPEVVVEAPPPPEPVRVGGGLSGRRTGLKAKNYRAVINDYPKALEFFAENPKVRETVQALADALARSAAHTAAPGCTVTHDEGTT